MEGGHRRRPVGSSKAWAEGPSMDVATREGPGTGQRAIRAGTKRRKGRQKAKEAHGTGTTSSSTAAGQRRARLWEPVGADWKEPPCKNQLRAAGTLDKT